MNSQIQRLSASARRAVQARNWGQVRACAAEILKCNGNSPEGFFLSGLAQKAMGKPADAMADFHRALTLDQERYDAAVELASLYLLSSQYSEAAALLDRYASHLGNSPRYLDLAGTIYVKIGLPERAWPLHQRAAELQPEAHSLQANLAACGVFVGRIDEAKAVYRRLLKKFPHHQRNHYELAQLETAMDDEHLRQMKDVLQATQLPADKNIFLYYAIGKELEDLEQWEEAFHFYQLAGNAVAKVANYDVSVDVGLIDKIIQTCDESWVGDAGARPERPRQKTPIFIVGLPRTGTTLTDRILSSHSQVESIGETFLLPVSLHRISGVQSPDLVNETVIDVAASKDAKAIAKLYMDAVGFRFGDCPYFVEKLPENFLYLGFIAKAFPEALIVHLRRNPMDACFAMYKQSFFKFAYTLEDLASYYVAHERLLRHWRTLLADRLIEVEYEALVADQEGQTRQLLARLGLVFEAACLTYEENETAINTASAVQVREKMHSRSVGRWRRFEHQLTPLKIRLEEAGISVD